MMKRSIFVLSAIGVLTTVTTARSATAFLDDFSASSLNSFTPNVPTEAATSYQLFSSKGWVPAPSVAANNLRFGINPTTSGHIEAQALFTTTPLNLTAVGDYVELVVTFTNSSGLLAQSGMMGFGLYDSGGVAPLTGGMESTAVLGTTGVTGGAQGWQGYLSRIWYSGGTHTIATRPTQAITTGNNQDLITTGSDSQSFTGGATLSSDSSTLVQAAGSQLTESLKLTLTAANTLSIESKLYSGANTSGTLLFSQSGIANGANFLTSSFDALCVGWRDTGNTAATRIEISSIRINTSLPIGSGNDVAGLYFEQQPGNASAGSLISPAVTVVATNSTGGPVTNVNVDISLASGSGPLFGSLSQTTDANGVATFNNLNLTTTGEKQLQASSGTATAISASFTINSASAAQLVFTTQPSDTQISNTIIPSVVVQLRDTYGNDVASNATISVALTSGTGVLGGTTGVATDASGKSTFADLSINLAGTKQLTASKSGLPSAASSTFDITSPLLPAFPGAEGAGAYTSGGRGGDVYYVTTLSDNNSSGALRYGINNAPAGGRTICFKVSGNIVLNSTLTINKPNITVAGQTAPGDGICFQNYSFNIAANNVIVRHLRSRLGTNALQEADCMWINSGTNIIVDHLSTSWSVDEVLSSSRSVSDLTVQNCFITEALNNSIHSKGSHGYGGILSSDNWTTFSYLRNLYAHNRSRNPRVGSSQDTNSPNTLRLDFRNNVIYNYGDRAGYTGGDPESCEINYVNNYCIKGPSSSYNYILAGGNTATHVYQSGNFIDLNLNSLVDGANTGWAMFSQTYTPFATPFAVPAATTESAITAYQRVVALSGAMPWRRDSADQRIAGTVRQQNGMIIDAVAQVGTWPTLVAESAPLDSDNDGMPNYWELAKGLNHLNAADRNNIDSSGYTELEVYLNWLADAHALCDRNGQIDVDLRVATGNSSNLTYSVANGSNGKVSLLGDGYTARFVAAANTNGPASFTFTATDPATASGFGPVNYGVLITTTNAPVSNNPPSLAAIPDTNVIAGATIQFTNQASDMDVPAQTLTFSLLNAPTGATLSSTSGVFLWRPTITQSPSTNNLSVVVTDNGIPNLSATQSFAVAVARPAEPQMSSAEIANGDFQFAVSGDVGPDYTIEASTNLVNWSAIFTTNSPVLPFSWRDEGVATFPQRYFRVLLGP